MSNYREKLYEEVWAEPMTKVAVRYGVSSSLMARICTRLNVPRPPRGYWAMLESGNALKRPPLPKARPGDPAEWARGQDSPDAIPTPPASSPQNTQGAVKSRNKKRHGLVANVREYFEIAKEMGNCYLRPAKRRLVDIYVTKGALNHALKAANQLFNAIEDRGHRVTLAPFNRDLERHDVNPCPNTRPDIYHNWRPDRPTVVYIGTVAIGISIFELSEDAEVRYVDGKFVRTSELSRRHVPGPYEWTSRRAMPTGRLCLRARSPYRRAYWERNWSESKPGELISLAPKIIEELEAGASEIPRLIEERERQAEIERQRREAEHQLWLKQQEERRRAQNIKEGREELLVIVESWALAKRIEAFFEDAERRASELPEQDRQGIVHRLSHARSLLGGVDALQRFLQWKAPADR